MILKVSLPYKQVVSATRECIKLEDIHIALYLLSYTLWGFCLPALIYLSYPWGVTGYPRDLSKIELDSYILYIKRT